MENRVAASTERSDMANCIEKINKFLDDLRDEFDIQSDRQLSRLINTAPSNICRVRSGNLPFGPAYILAIHEVFDIPVKEIRERIGAA